MEFEGDHPVVNNLEDDIRPVLSIERNLERVPRDKRSILIDRLSRGEFQEAEEEASEVFDNMDKYYSFVADVVELFQSRHVQRAIRHQHKAFNGPDKYEKSKKHLERSKKDIQRADKEMDKAKRIMDHYSHKLHQAKGRKEIFEDLVESFSTRKEQLNELRNIQSKFEGFEPSS
jgi:hypothetical protein